MRKKLTLLVLSVVGSFASAQCNIIGKPILSINETGQYSVDVDGQCPDCYQWKSMGNNIVFMDSGKGKNISIKGSGSGQATLSIVVLSMNGIIQCSHNIWVNSNVNSNVAANTLVNNTTTNINSSTPTDTSVNINKPDINSYFTSPPAATMNTENVNPNCDIGILDIQEAKVSDNIMGFFPSVTPNNFKYSWEVEYFDGEKTTSTEKVSQFSYDKKTKPFKSVKLKVLSGRCLRELTKTYDQGFWNFFN